MDWRSVYGDFSDLPKLEQLRLFQAIQETLFPEPKEDIANMIGDMALPKNVALATNKLALWLHMTVVGALSRKWQDVGVSLQMKLTKH